MPRGVRPTTQKVKQALFNILGDRVKEAKILDLFAGSGNIGIEALSRGAKKVIFVDNDFTGIDTIRRNLNRWDFLGAAEIKHLDFEKALSIFAKKEEKFDLIFADPPYGQGLAEKALQSVDQCDILSSNGLLIIEHFKKDILSTELGNLTLKQQKKYGDTVIRIYTNHEDHESIRITKTTNQYESRRPRIYTNHEDHESIRITN